MLLQLFGLCLQQKNPDNFAHYKVPIRRSAYVYKEKNDFSRYKVPRNTQHIVIFFIKNWAFKYGDFPARIISMHLEKMEISLVLNFP